MSSYTKLAESHVGRHDGVNPSDQETYLVEIDAITDDPVAVLSTASAVPRGTPHPHDSTLFAQSYDIVSRENPYHYRVRVNYGHLSGVDYANDDWHVSYSSSSQPYTMRKTVGSDATAKIIGPLVYKSADPMTPPNYVEAPASPTHKTRLVGGTEQDLWVTEQRKAIGHPAEWPSVYITFWKNVPTIYRTMGRRVSQYLETTNADILTVNGDDVAYAHELMFKGFGITEGTGTLPGGGQDEYGRIYRIELQFLWVEKFDDADNPGEFIGGHTPLRLYHQYVDDQGNESQVFTLDGKPVWENFDVAHVRDFGTLLSIVG